MDDERVMAEDQGVSVVRREEQVRVGAQRIPTERVRLVKHVVTEQVTRTFEVRREELRVERVPIEGAAPDVSLGYGAQAGTPLEIVLHEEEVVVESRVVPRERVRVWVERITEQQQVSAQLGREEVVVEQVEAGPPVR